MNVQWWHERRKAVFAVATAVVEVVAVWQDAPQWALMIAAAAGAVLVYSVPNRPSLASLPALSADELLELARKAEQREAR
jgi:hypothetical protein